jgi:hypothetical protein
MSRKPVAYYPELAEVLGGRDEALFVQQIAHWADWSKNDGWVFRTKEELNEELYMPPSTQYRVRGRLKKLGVLEEELRGMPRKLFYRVNFDKIESLLGPTEDADMVHPVGPGWSDKPDQGGPTDLYESKDENKDENVDTVPAELSANVFVDHLVQEVDDQLPAMTQSRKARYGREFKQQIKAGASEGELYEAVSRVAERWPDYQLSVEQAIRDNQKLKSKRREDHPHPQGERSGGAYVERPSQEWYDQQFEKRMKEQT